MNKWVKDEGETTSSLCRMISKPTGRICRNQIRKEGEPGTRAELLGAARGEVREASLLWLHNSLKPRGGASKGRNDNFSQVVRPWNLSLRREPWIASNLATLLASALWDYVWAAHTLRQVDRLRNQAIWPQISAFLHISCVNWGSVFTCQCLTILISKIEMIIIVHGARVYSRFKWDNICHVYRILPGTL